MNGYSSMQINMYQWGYKNNDSYPEWVTSENYQNCEGFANIFSKAKKKIRSIKNKIDNIC